MDNLILRVGTLDGAYEGCGVIKNHYVAFETWKVWRTNTQLELTHSELCMNKSSLRICK